MKKLVLVLTLLVNMASLIAGTREVQINGELTGAGSKFNVKDLVALLDEDQIIPRQELERIVIKNVKEPKLSDITAVQIDGQLIDAKEFSGFIVNQQLNP